MGIDEERANIRRSQTDYERTLDEIKIVTDDIICDIGQQIADLIRHSSAKGHFRVKWNPEQFLSRRKSVLRVERDENGYFRDVWEFEVSTGYGHRSIVLKIDSGDHLFDSADMSAATRQRYVSQAVESAQRSIARNLERDPPAAPATTGCIFVLICMLIPLLAGLGDPLISHLY